MKTIVPPAAIACLALAGAAHAAIPVLAPGDFIIAVNSKTSAPNSSYPGGEPPGLAIDGNNSNKYLNFGGFGTGFIATPAAPAAMQSFTITTGNDAAGRDPARYEIWGTNEAIVSTDNSTGTGETWTLVSSGSLALPAGRNEVSAPVSFVNATVYSSYKVVFPTLKSDDRMQISEFSAYTGANATGSGVFSAGNAVIAIDTPVSASRHPLGESPANLIDGVGTTKYLNFGGSQTGVIVTPSVGPTIVGSMLLTTGNDIREGRFPGRNPTSFEIYGTNDAVTSFNNGYGNDELWTLISSGPLTMPATDSTEADLIAFANSTSYTSYKVVFPTLAGANDIFELGELQLFAVPEPGVALLSCLALLGLTRRRR